MVKKLLILTVSLMLLGGCAVSKYRPAERYLESREYDNAIRAYLQLLDPHIRQGKRMIFYDKEAITGIGVVYWHRKRYETAMRILNLVVEKNPEYGKALFYLGMSHEGLAKDDDAINVYKNYDVIDPMDPYRGTVVGRLDWLVRKKVTREVRMALNREAELNFVDYPEKSIAVLNFLSLSEDEQWQVLQKGIAEMIITDLSQVDDLKIIERLRVERLREELSLSATGMMDTEKAPRVGKLLGARNLVKGSYLISRDRQLKMDAGIYRAGEVEKPTTADMEGDLAHLFRLEKELVFRILDHFQIALTPEQRDQILKIPTENMMAFMNYCRGLDALDNGDFEAAQMYFRQASRIDPNFQWAQDHIMSPDIWLATHNRNPVRVSHEVAQILQSLPPGRVQRDYRPPQLVSTWTRLQNMSYQQNAAFIPGTDSHKSILEADLKGAPVIPILLSEPPTPPGNR